MNTKTPNQVLLADLAAFSEQTRTTGRVPEDWYAPSGRAWREMEDAAKEAAEAYTLPVADVYRGIDGIPVVAIDTTNCSEWPDGAPLMRVNVNDALVYGQPRHETSSENE